MNTALKKMMGIKDVSIDKDIIRVTYDLLEVTTNQIEITLEEIGHNLASSWGEKLKRAFIHFLEETELDNLEQQQSSHGHHHH